jgi:hypothetical protein
MIAMANGSDAGRASNAGRAGRGRSKRVGQPIAARSILRGEIDNVGLPTLLTILDLERRSGMVVVERRKVLGRLHVRHGRVIRARVEGTRRAPSTGAEAVYEMLGWSDGQFELWQTAPTDADGQDEVGESTTFLLIEAARRADEAAGVLQAHADPF